MSKHKEIKMNKTLPTLGFLCLIAGILLGGMARATAPSSPVTALLTDGKYTVYNIQPMYDTKDGEPIFYVIGGKGHMSPFGDGSSVYVEPNDITLFFVPRRQISNVEQVVPGTTYKVVVENGIGRLE